MYLLSVFTVVCSSFQRRQEEGGLLSTSHSSTHSWKFPILLTLSMPTSTIHQGYRNFLRFQTLEWTSIYVSTWTAGWYTRSKPPELRPSSLYLSHDGTFDLRKEIRLDSHAKVSVSGILIRPDFLPCDPNIRIWSQDLGDHSVPPESMGVASSYVADHVRFVCANREISFPGSPSHIRSPALHVATLIFKSANKWHMDPHFFCSGQGSTMVDVGTQCSDGSSSNPEGSMYIFVHGCFVHRLGCALELLDSLRYLVNDRDS